MQPPHAQAEQPTSERDYNTWQHDDLVRRVHRLEQKLRRQTQSLQQTTTVIENGKNKKLKKPPKRFDSSKYTTRKIALKFAYLGANYNGFEHSSNKTRLPTIEEMMWKALMKTRLIFPERKPGQDEEEVCWDGCDYSKCGRTDKGVSAFGQVIALRVRSARPIPKTLAGDAEIDEAQSEPRPFDPVRDELPYIQLLNRVLPPDIRVLAWCEPPADFSARFSCRERRYRYFFTNPAYMPTPGEEGRSTLDIEAMGKAAAKYKGVHDFRNLCKVDPSKQITDWRRRIFHADIHEVDGVSSPKLYYFEVRGSAFVWHQVRDLVAILFLVGQGYEQPEIVDKLLDVEQLPGSPVYDMASDVPLVLWDCIFPDLTTAGASSHLSTDTNLDGYEDALPWIYVGDKAGGRDSLRRPPPLGDGKYGSGGIMEDIWSLWRKQKLHEVLAQQLMNVVAHQGTESRSSVPEIQGRGDRIFDGSEEPRSVGTYVPVMQRARMDPPDVLNARYLARMARKRDSESDAGE